MHVDHHICFTKVGTQAYRQRSMLVKGKALDYFLKAIAYKTNQMYQFTKELCNRLQPGLL